MPIYGHRASFLNQIGTRKIIYFLLKIIKLHDILVNREIIFCKHKYRNDYLAKMISYKKTSKLQRLGKYFVVHITQLPALNFELN